MPVDISQSNVPAEFKMGNSFNIKDNSNTKVPGLLAVPEIAVKNRDLECVLKHGYLAVIKRQQQHFCSLGYAVYQK